MNEPWCYSWHELMDMPLMALALIWSKPESEASKINHEEIIERQKRLKRERGLPIE